MPKIERSRRIMLPGLGHVGSTSEATHQTEWPNLFHAPVGQRRPIYPTAAVDAALCKIRELCTAGGLLSSSTAATGIPC